MRRGTSLVPTYAVQKHLQLLQPSFIFLQTNITLRDAQIQETCLTTRKVQALSKQPGILIETKIIYRFRINFRVLWSFACLFPGAPPLWAWELKWSVNSRLPQHATNIFINKNKSSIPTRCATIQDLTRFYPNTRALWSPMCNRYKVTKRIKAAPLPDMQQLRIPAKLRPIRRCRMCETPICNRYMSSPVK